MISPHVNAARNIAGGFLMGYGLATFACVFLLVQLWRREAPNTTDIAHGFVFAHDEHGRITYFSAFPVTSEALLLATSIPLSLIGWILTPKKDFRPLGGRWGWRGMWDQDDHKGLYKPSVILGALAAPAIVFLIGPFLVRWLNDFGYVFSFQVGRSGQ